MIPPNEGDYLIQLKPGTKKTTEEVIAEIREVMGKNLTLPAGSYITCGGTYAEQQTSFRELLFILIASVFLVFAVLLFMFRDFRMAFLVIFISILGIGGCIWALYLTGIQLNVGSYTGIIMIVGIIAENAIFTVNKFVTSYKITGDVDKSVNYAICCQSAPS